MAEADFKVLRNSKLLLLLEDCYFFPHTFHNGLISSLVCLRNDYQLYSHVSGFVSPLSSGVCVVNPFTSYDG